MNLVDTPDYRKTEIKRTPDGKPDYNAYVGMEGTIEENGLIVNVVVLGARSRYGHLDLQVTPKAGEGTRWVERKNINLCEEAPALPVAASEWNPYQKFIATR
jgi:hypothetical protein